MPQPAVGSITIAFYVLPPSISEISSAPPSSDSSLLSTTQALVTLLVTPSTAQSSQLVKDFGPQAIELAHELTVVAPCDKNGTYPVRAGDSCSGELAPSPVASSSSTSLPWWAILLIVIGGIFALIVVARLLMILKSRPHRISDGKADLPPPPMMRITVKGGDGE